MVWGPRIWLTTASDDGHELSAVCVDRESGRIIHDLKLFDVAVPQEIHKFNSHASPTPALEEGRVYVTWGSDGTACLDSETGRVLWSRRDLPCNHFRGAGSSPILFENLLILHFDGFDYQYVVAFDKQTGDIVWRTDRPENFGTTDGDFKKAYGTPLVITVSGQPQLISPCSKGTFAYDPRTGAELWRIRFNGFSTACRPLFGDGLLFISTGFSKGEMVAVRPDGHGDVTDTHVVWTSAKAMPSKPSPLLIDHRLFTVADNGVAMCLDAATGEQVWQARVGGNYSGSPIFAGGYIYLSSEEGKTTVLRPGPEYDLVAENHLDEGFMASPAVAGHSLFLRTRTHLYRIDDKTQTVARGEAPHLVPQDVPAIGESSRTH